MVSNLIPWRRRKDVRVSKVPREEEHPYLALHRHWNDLFDEFFHDFEVAFGLPLHARGGHTLGVAAPSVDVSETDDAIEVKADLPGLDEKEVEVTLEDDALVIRGEKKQEREEKKRDYHLTERTYGEFQRVIPMPRGLDADKVKASFKKGVLHVTLPKTPEARQNRRSIHVSAE